MTVPNGAPRFPFRLSRRGSRSGSDERRPDVTQQRLDAVEFTQTLVTQRSQSLANQVRDLSVLVDTVGPLTALEEQHAAVAEQVRHLAARVDELAGWFASADRRLANLEDAQARTWTQLEQIHGVQARHAMLFEIDTVMTWVADAVLDTGPLVSVVMPTHNRSHLLTRAISTVLTQSYPHWELLVVDDGSVDDTRDVLSTIDDERVRVFSTENRGVCAARNTGIDHARGDLIAYLDDDNIMHSDWLKAVVWRFGQEPTAEVVWGAIVVDDLARIDQRGRGTLPWLSFLPYDRERILDENIADIGAIAHRAGLAEARFDESLREMGDWDLFLRLTRDRDPLPLPAVACLYTTDGPDRLSHGPTYDADLAKVKTKNRRS